jgi:imidazolonepropionase-like amidohydrolase
MFIARMGQDSANINDSIDAFAAEASKRGLNVQVVKYPQGVHGFDISQDTDESKRIIGQAISFVKAQLLGPLTMQVAAPPRAAVVISHVTIVDPAIGVETLDQTVVVSDRKIVDVGAQGEIKIPAGARVIDGKGKFLIPGLWDMHVHLLWEPAIDTLFPLCIANGVTGVRDMHTHFSFEQIHRWQREVEEGKRVGPRFVYAGPILDGPQPIWPGSIAVANAEAGRKAVRDVKANGSSYVKVYERLPREAYFSIADEAKKQGIPFVGHVPGSITPAEASDAGQKSIEHLSHYLENCNTGNVLSYDASKAAALFEKFWKNHTWQCPTLIVTQTTTFGREDRIAKDPRRKYFTPTILSRVGFDDSKRDWDFTLKFWTEEQKLMRDMLKTNLDVLAGTDTPIVRNVPGFTLHDELKLLVEAGYATNQALAAATSNPARFLGMENSMGSIEKGKAADLVLLNADPMEDIANTTKIEAVVADGRLYDRKALDKLLESVEAEAKAEKGASTNGH